MEHESQAILSVHTDFKSFLVVESKPFFSLDLRHDNFHNKEILPGF